MGMPATATAATMVTMFTAIDRTEPVSSEDDETANVPNSRRIPIAKASATINPMIRLRRRCGIPDLALWSDIRFRLVTRLLAPKKRSLAGLSNLQETIQSTAQTSIP